MNNQSHQNCDYVWGVIKFWYFENSVSHKRSLQSVGRRSVFNLTDKGEKIIKNVAPETESLYREIELLFGEEKFNQIFLLLERFSSKVNKD